MAALAPRADQMVLGAPNAFVATSSGTPYTYPAYPGTQHNDPGFNITYPAADNYYAAQRFNGYSWSNKSGTPVETRGAWWIGPPSEWKQRNRWPVVWEYHDGFADSLGGPVLDGALSLQLLRYDPVSGTSESRGGILLARDRDVTCADATYPDRPTATCVKDLESSVCSNTGGDHLHQGRDRGAPPGDTYFVALMDSNNYITVSELFSVKEAPAFDPGRPEWVKGPAGGAGAGLSIPSSAALFQLVLVLSVVIAWMYCRRRATGVRHRS